jgi:CBS domain-containing protein
MKALVSPKSASWPLTQLRAKDLMSPNPLSIRRDATVYEALEVLTDRGFGAAPVIDEAGRPIGVVSRTDILIHQRESVHHPCPYDSTDVDLLPDSMWFEGLLVDVPHTTTVAEVMTPAIFTVSLETPALEVIRRMLELRVHHLFVIDDDLAPVGVISPLDVLRHLGEGE